jgi:hypothetical protein
MRDLTDANYQPSQSDHGEGDGTMLADLRHCTHPARLCDREAQSHEQAQAPEIRDVPLESGLRHDQRYIHLLRAHAAVDANLHVAWLAR